MALKISTVDGNQITGLQARGLHQIATSGSDIILANFGGAFNTPAPTGFEAKVSPGMIICDGVIVENTSEETVVMPKPATNGAGALVLTIDMGAKTATLSMGKLEGYVKNDLVAFPTGKRQIPLFFFSYTQSGITGWQDWRPLASKSSVPTGTIVQFAGSTAPQGWLLCDGTGQYNIKYPELAAVLGSTWGVSDPGTFKLPDFRGKVPVALNRNDSDFNVVGKTGGAKTHTLTGDELPTHQVYTSSVSAGPYYENAIPAGKAIPEGAFFGVALPKIGKNAPHNNLQPYVTVNFIIKY